MGRTLLSDAFEFGFDLSVPGSIRVQAGKVKDKVKGGGQECPPHTLSVLSSLCFNSAVDPIAHFSRLFAYDSWANQEALASLRAAGTPQPQPLKLMAHIFAAERLWMERLEQKPQTIPVWPEFTAEECERQAAELPALWKNYLTAGSEAGLAAIVTYQNSQGETWSSRKDDILTHVITHSIYHRGQVAAAVRAAGFTPAYTDFIHSIRQAFVK